MFLLEGSRNKTGIDVLKRLKERCYEISSSESCSRVGLLEGSELGLGIEWSSLKC
jgi:hypothetical protein